MSFRYRAKELGFFNGETYGPREKRRKIVESETELKPVPSWLEPIKSEPSPAAKGKGGAKGGAKGQTDQQQDDGKSENTPDFTGGDSPVVL